MNIISDCRRSATPKLQNRMVKHVQEAHGGIGSLFCPNCLKPSMLNQTAHPDCGGTPIPNAPTMCLSCFDLLLRAMGTPWWQRKRAAKKMMKFANKEELRHAVENR